MRSRQEALHDLHTSKGLCRCGRKPQPGFKCCDFCRKNSAKRQIAHRLIRASNGLCICGRPLEGGAKCKKCRRANFEWHKTKRKTLQHPSIRAYCGLLAKSKRDLGKRETSRDREFSLTGSQLVQIWESQKGICALSGLQLSHELHTLESASVDRINSTGGYTIDNIQLVCRWANYAKNKHTDGELKQILDKIRAQGAS